MKTTKRLAQRATVIVICASFVLLTFGAWMAFAAGATLQETEAVWGTPIGVQKLDNGVEKRFYKYDNTMDFGVRYFVYKDGRVIDNGMGRFVATKEKVEKDGLPISELSQAYYRNHPTTVQEVDQTWGKPEAVRKLENGSEERFYKYDNTMDIGFRYFLVKDGKVVASGLAKVTGVPAKATDEQKAVPVSFMKSTNTSTIADVESTWGKPLVVKKLDGGMEKRYYKASDNTMNFGNRMFLFKDGRAVATDIANP